MRRTPWSLALAVALVLSAALANAGPAAGNGYCGADPTGATACPVTTNETLSGSIASGSELDYYVFYVAHQSALQLTINDTENAQCSNDYPYYPYICGWVGAELLSGSGHEIGGPQNSSPDNGVAVPESYSVTIPRGTYYVEVSGYQGDGTLPAIPYQLTVDGNPGVQWPPACVVPRLRSHTRLGRAKHAIQNHRCTVGRVRYISGTRTPTGDVIRLRPGAGSILPYAAPVTVYVSGHPPGHRRHHHHRR